MANAGKSARTKGAASALIDPGDVRTYLVEQAVQLAPADIEALARRQTDVKRQITADGDRHPLFERQVRLAMRIVTDHDEGECPQIPYFTISVLAAAILYVLQPIDLIPDFLPEGGADDGLIVALAFELARPGVERYCQWKGLRTAQFLSAGRVLPEKSAVPKRGASTARKRTPSRRRR